ncbi:M23 family metallopeptidase [Leifsonia sp. TF02-11]|uniref:M23 family metallopeptidase n=1 Tax=Leifsonia sp. TF02-11 TaxID=2815212 RepID=UPI001AA17978|nr:M23 family metallopeptidase [Leifsonia sp. TF02-11]MBO1738242.1 M23 family metallopeptidase [Leifsonia sp. TF02-11]
MLRFTPFSHTLTATGLVLGLAATSTLTVTVTPAAAEPARVSTSSASLAAQDLIVGADGDGAVFGIARELGSVLVPPTVVWPVLGATVSDGFGHRESPTEGASTDHQGVDFAARLGEPVRTAATGVVSAVVSEDRGGCGVTIAIDHVMRGQKITTVYCHLAAGSVRVAPGQSVVVGDTIAAVGSTGTSTGAHLHFEVRPNGAAAIDPLPWLGALAA